MGFQRKADETNRMRWSEVERRRHAKTMKVTWAKRSSTNLASLQS